MAHIAPVIHTLLHELFDYAGLFPPASLDFKTMLETAGRFRETLQSPSLVGSEVVVPEKDLLKLDDLSLMYAGFRSGDPLRIAVLGDVGRTLERSSFRLFRKTHVESTIDRRFTSYEVKIPQETSTESKTIHAILGQLSAYVGDPTITLALELDGARPDLHERLSELSNALASFGARISQRTALKLRCAGPTAITLPMLARAIAITASQNVRLKLTMGLHHPFLNPPRYQNEFGFLTVAIAAALRMAHADAFTESAILDCLMEPELGAFTFEDGIQWKHWNANTTQVKLFSEQRRLSIGSCNLHEPDEDLSLLFPETSAASAASTAGN